MKHLEAAQNFVSKLGANEEESSNVGISTSPSSQSEITQFGVKNQINGILFNPTGKHQITHANDPKKDSIISSNFSDTQTFYIDNLDTQKKVMSFAGNPNKRFFVRDDDAEDGVRQLSGTDIRLIQ